MKTNTRPSKFIDPKDLLLKPRTSIYEQKQHMTTRQLKNITEKHSKTLYILLFSYIVLMSILLFIHN